MKKNAETAADWILPKDLVQQNYHACSARAKKLILDRLFHYNRHYGFSYHRVSIKDMKTRWGSCSSKMNLNFHYRLLFLPVELLDYVVVHELCHLKEMNHSRAFWKLVGEHISNYQYKRQELKRFRI